ncbi:hypothetical protein FOCC_FOCC006412 [Frankliniella occidentalis]|uniref:Zinc finger protein 182-like n=1 Tax=Frankliniella occidentalis TaxID=133901 RepID=A0A6J1S807_FRAOC|nr:zinc finger protein 182-like [Frankliniella occidentalis]XP_026277324.1 zinc finger protein 182-like [Frankliniella occidentalis]XP_026277325.1 zinc finger protein 182-like [Frankliniella occidentalis]XP_052123502.1 zinc finger protein 182-like [Frankliniella occidentalis]KAE8746853.1 hypothetical protein FOCC_FOCC006412 [Frankliniella occidentalis]
MSQMKIILNTTDGNTISVDVRPEETYRMLRERIQVESGIELELSQIVYNGKQVEEDQNVYDSFLGAQSLDKSSEPNILCVVEGCPSTKLTHPKKEIFKFPLETDRFSTWLLACNRHDLLGRIPVSLNLECGVCADHFPDSCFLSGSMKKRLRKNAVPILEEQQTNFNILAQDMMMADVKLEDAVSLNDIQDSDHLLPDSSDLNDQILKKPTTDDNQEEVDEEDLQEDELEELEEDEDEDEEADVEDDDDILVDSSSCHEHPGLLCRLCAQQVDTAHFIFNEKGREEKLFDKISNSLPINIHCNDPLPKQICGQCLSTLNICYNFGVACTKAEETLQKMVSRFKCQTENKPNDPLSPIEEISSMDEGILEEKNEKSACYNCPLCCEGNMESQDNVNIDEIEGRQGGDEDIVHDFLADSVLWEEEEDPLDSNYPEDEESETADDGADDDETYPCLLCGASFIALPHLFQHSESHQDIDCFPCGHCALAFNTKDALAVHLDLVINSACDEQYKCSECGKLFLSEARAEFHHEVTHGINGFSSLSCSECGQVFRHETNLWDHVQIVHKGQKPFSCPKCDDVFQARAQLKAHLKVHDSVSSFICGVCSEAFPSRSSLKSHEASHANEKLFSCEHCDRCFSRKYLLTAHVRTHLDKKPRAYTCRVCGEDGFDSLPKLLVHRRSKHQDVMLPLGSKKDKIHKCEQCNKAFTGRVALKHHAMSHAGELPHVCEFCNKGFTQKRSLLLHRRIHTGEKPYACGECGKRFVQSAHLYSHLRLHTGEKPYPCSECGATFRLKDVRDSHQRKHTGERPFKCKVCDKSFRTSHSYYQHTWIHTGRKPYPCNYCGKAFRRSNGLKVHIRIHTGEKPHKCEVCGRGFAQKQDMKKHYNLHMMGRL